LYRLHIEIGVQVMVLGMRGVYVQQLYPSAACMTLLGTLCITLARLWQSDRNGLQGVFLQPIAGLLVRKTTQ
jgi:hypothetical protein